MKVVIYKTVTYVAAVILCAILFVKVGNELIVQMAMMYEGVSDRNLLAKDSGIAMIAIYALIPEALFGAIGGWYLAEWLSEKIWD